MTDEILKRIDALAAKLGVTADHLWAVLVKESRIEAMEALAWALLWAAISFVLVKIAQAVWQKAKADEDYYPLAIGIGAISLVPFLFACYEIAGTPGMLLNPEYWALKRIAEALGK